MLPPGERVLLFSASGLPETHTERCGCGDKGSRAPVQPPDGYNDADSFLAVVPSNEVMCKGRKTLPVKR